MTHKHMMSDVELEAAGNALINWMKSQEISPANGTAIFIKLIATHLVAKTTDLDRLQFAVDNIKELLTTEIVLELKRKTNV